MKTKRILMATGNGKKYDEAQITLAKVGFNLEFFKINRIEIQADDIAEIAVYSLKQIVINEPIIVEDAGLFIDHYEGFPGPYSSYMLKTIGLRGILKLMKGVKNREASFQSAVAYRDEIGIRVFRGVVKGKISEGVHGPNGFGYDPIFIPNEGDGRTFGGMSTGEKELISHRARAFRGLGEWLIHKK